MDLYSILGHQLSVENALPQRTDPAAGMELVAEPSYRPLAELPNLPHHASLTNQALPNNGHPEENSVQSEADTAAHRELSDAKLNAILGATVDRVRYITNASGVALALCENEEDDAMVCRASSGPAAPEVGARMYIRSGITGESMKTRQTLRCDRASTDPRVNQESCKALGIESVMVMPLILGRSVVGMFELFGARAEAFAERDATTLRAAVPLVVTSLREAVEAGMPLGRIPWAEENPSALAENAADSSGKISAENAAESTKDISGTVSDVVDETPITLVVPVAFPIDTFRKSDAQEVAEHSDTPRAVQQEVQQEDQQQDQPEDLEVPAFLARLADEARPAASRTWSQWFRPQW